MSQTEQKIDRLSQILEWFIERQESFNSKQESFNSKQESFNDRIESKLDKAQYFLEESIANNAKMFFEEQTKQASRIRMLDDEVMNLKSNIHQMWLDIRALQKA